MPAPPGQHPSSPWRRPSARWSARHLYAKASARRTVLTRPTRTTSRRLPSLAAPPGPRSKNPQPTGFAALPTASQKLHRCGHRAGTSPRRHHAGTPRRKACAWTSRHRQCAALPTASQLHRRGHREGTSRRRHRQGTSRRRHRQQTSRRRHRAATPRRRHRAGTSRRGDRAGASFRRHRAATSRRRHRAGTARRPSRALARWSSRRPPWPQRRAAPLKGKLRTVQAAVPFAKRKAPHGWSQSTASSKRGACHYENSFGRSSSSLAPGCGTLATERQTLRNSRTSQQSPWRRASH
mmetsp:Transcript_16264/g.44567  ORF Transcript_16264/g.44567 Transcript_16264/m.44567 type:complete len:294 (-) Transcript_16264:93-974(-)